MKKSIMSALLLSILFVAMLPSYAQVNSTSQDFHMLQQQKNQGSPPLSYAVFYVTENDTCSDSEYQSLKFYQVVSDEYLSLYGISHDLQGSLCVPLKNYQSYFSGLSTFTLPIVISDNVVGQQLVKQGFYGMYEITGTGKQAIYVCSCDAKIESWAGAWILSHELSHFSLRYFGESDDIAVAWVHYIQALENECQKGDFGKVCPQYSESVTSPSGNQIPVMILYGQGPSTSLPKDAPQSEAPALVASTIVPVQNPMCITHQICAMPGDYVEYKISNPDLDQTVRFDFLSPTDNKNITVKTTVTQNGSSAYEFDTLDLSKSLFSRPNGIVSTFMYLMPVPLQLNSAYSQDHMKFESYERDVLSAKNNNQTSSILVQIDRRTGILMQFLASNTVDEHGTVSVNRQSYQLIDTNMIVDSDYPAQDLMSIPPWIKQSAKSWYDGSLSDMQFAQGIRYMAENNMMKVPSSAVNNSHVLIPSWVKNDARFWYDGSLSDDEFIGAIQYLVSYDIIHVPGKSSTNEAGFMIGKIKLGGEYLDVEIADTQEQKTQGLQHHSLLSYSQGMLFPFARPQAIPIWMKDMQFPIDVIWFDDSGNVIHVEKDVQPCTNSCPIYGGYLTQAKYVLEVASGFVDKFGIGQGTVLQVLT